MKMEIIDIEKYLTQKNCELEQDVFNDIENYRKSYIKEQNEPLANYFWCLKTIYMAQRDFLFAFREMKTGKYEEAWTHLDSSEMLLSFLSQNFNLGIEEDKYHLVFIAKMIKEYQKLFPYQYFFSRECVIKSERCSICGEQISLRKSCGHRVGKVYMGEQCFHEITDFEFKGVALVKNPYDKYTYVKPEGKEYNYGMIEMLMSGVKHPYDEFWVEVKKVKRPEYKDVGRNDLCPCGSGMKYKKCHCGKEGEQMNHNIVHLLHSSSATNIKGIRIFETWKE